MEIVLKKHEQTVKPNKDWELYKNKSCRRSSNMVDMQCMLQISPTRLLMAGHQDKIIDFNLTRGKETGLVSFYKCL